MNHKSVAHITLPSRIGDMLFSSFVVGGGEKYQRIGRIKVESAVLNSDAAALLNGPDSSNDGDEEQEQKQERFISTPKHRALAFARKSVQDLDVSIRLRIRRMDTTTFDVEVSKNATVAELKVAVQRRFEPTEAGGCQVSWPHVWGNFCLSFKGQKLLDESVHLQQVGIDESHELVFVRHLASRSPRQHQRRGFLDALKFKQWLST